MAEEEIERSKDVGLEAKGSEREDRRPRRPGLYDFLKNALKN